jgi:hypothetical protein
MNVALLQYWRSTWRCHIQNKGNGKLPKREIQIYVCFLVHLWKEGWEFVSLCDLKVINLM